MELAQFSHASAWRSLLWKDWQQIKSMLLAVVIGLAGVQLLLCAISSLDIDKTLGHSLLQAAKTLACLAPVLIVVGCCGLLVGQERQTGTWHWSTSLPVHWSTAVGSKLLVTLAAAAVALLMTLIIPTLALSISPVDRMQLAWMDSFFSFFSILFLVEVFVILTLACLLLREPLTAIAFAGIAIIIGQFAFFAFLAETVLKFVAVSNEGEVVVSHVTICVMLLIGAVPMLFAFRWRWGTGQFAAFYTRPAHVALPPTALKLVDHTLPTPSQWWMLTQHSWANHFWLKVDLAFASLLLTSVGGAVFAVQFSAILGLTTFEGDQTLGRFRFLADRGVSPTKLAFSRILVSFLWWIALVVVPLAVRHYVDDNVLATAAALDASLLVFFFAALVSLCFRRIILGITVVAVVALIAIGICVGIYAESFRFAAANFRIQPYRLFWFLNLALLLPSICILIAGMIHVSKRWIIHGNESLTLRFAGICTMAAILPLLFASHFAFLLLPKPNTWPLPAPQPQTTIRAVDLLSLDDPLLTRGLPEFERISLQNLDNFLPQFISDFHVKLDSVRSAEPNAEQPDEAKAEVDQRKLAHQAIMQESVAKIENLLDAPDSEVHDIGKFLIRLNLALFRSAIAAHICMENGDSATATRFWRVNRRLQETGQQVNPSITSEMRILSMKLLARTRATQIAPMKLNEFLRDLVPPEADERTQYEQEVLAYAQDLKNWLITGKSTLQPEHFERGGIAWLRLYPPAKWFLERSAAVFSIEQFDTVRRFAKDHLSGKARAELIAKMAMVGWSPTDSKTD